jgi:hypothetical protein
MTETALVPISGPEIVEYEAAVTAGRLFGGSTPAELLAKATAAADTLAHVLEAKKLYTVISGRKHVRVEGWTLLGTMLGVFPICTWTKEVEGGYEARVEARTLGGQLVSAAEAVCLHSEANWKSRDEYALKSMAQTRATSKALRLPLGFVVVLAGYEATPAEEMVAEVVQTKKIAPAAQEEDLTPILEASLAKVREAKSIFDPESIAQDVAQKLADEKKSQGLGSCPHCSSGLVRYTSKKGDTIEQCESARSLYFEALDHGATQKEASQLTKAHHFRIVP